MAKYDFEADRKRALRFAKRAGLSPATTSIDWGYERTGGGEVLVRLETYLFLSQEEFAELYNDEKGTE